MLGQAGSPEIKVAGGGGAFSLQRLIKRVRTPYYSPKGDLFKQKKTINQREGARGEGFDRENWPQCPGDSPISSLVRDEETEGGLGGGVALGLIIK